MPSLTVERLNCARLRYLQGVGNTERRREGGKRRGREEGGRKRLREEGAREEARMEGRRKGSREEMFSRLMLHPPYSGGI